MARAAAANSLLLKTEEARLLVALRQAGIEAIAVKGTSLARLLSRDATSRFCGDVDLVVREADVFKAGEVLHAAGYESRLWPRLLTHPPFLRDADEHTSEVVYLRRFAGASVLVELHWRPLHLPGLLLWNSMESYEVESGSAPIRTLDPAMYLLLLCGHVSGHGWAGLRWLCDVADFLVRFEGRIEPSRFLKLCDLAGLRRRAGTTFALLEAYFGIRWAAAEKLSSSRVRRDARRYFRRPLAPVAPAQPAAVHWERIRLQDSALRRMRYLLWLLRPTHTEWVKQIRSEGQVQYALRPGWSAYLVRLTRLLGMIGPIPWVRPAAANSDAVILPAEASPHPAPGGGE